MKTIVNLEIKIFVEKVKEKNIEYYLAYSPDVKGFMAEANSLDEIKEITPGIIQDLFEAKIERIQAKQRAKKSAFELSYFLYKQKLNLPCIC